MTERATRNSRKPPAPVRGKFTRALAGMVALATLLQSLPAAAQAEPKLSIIRDAEIEQLLREYTLPIFRAAKINASATKIILVGDRSFNAFVANGQKIFINVGAIMDAKTPNELIGVLAHESGHIAGGHLARMRQELARAQILAVAGMLMGAGAVVAQARSGPYGKIGSDRGGMMGAMLGPQELIRRSLLAYQRGEEQAADRAAVNYLTSTGQSARGLLTTMERFQNDALFKTSQIDPYLMSHPLPSERISSLESAAKAAPSFAAKDAPALQARHDLARAKLFGFMGGAAEVGRRYPASDNSVPARYARAIAAYRQGRIDQALSLIDGLIAAEPGSPYFQELKGQTLMESGRAAQSLPYLRRAAALAPNALPIRVLLGHALVGTGNPADAKEATTLLTQAVQRDDDYAEAWQFLSMAYERRGDTPNSQLAAAQALFLQGNMVAARTQADRAQKQFKPGTPGWLKADDILNYRPPKFD
jgi:predicted Zn-dependent protease